MDKPNLYEDEKFSIKKNFLPFNFILSLLLLFLTIGVKTDAHDFSSEPVLLYLPAF